MPVSMNGAKPWDKIRQPAKTPIGSGSFKVGGSNATVHVGLLSGPTVAVSVSAYTYDRTIRDRGYSQIIDARGCRELSEFFAELADQFDRDDF